MINGDPNTEVEPTPETSYVSNMYQAIDAQQQNICISNHRLS
jgi:hypothetical protein